MHDVLFAYEQAGAKIDLLAMANVTSVLGNKGQSHPFVCADNTDGSNILSVAFAPSDLVVAAAFESNTGAAWRPAAFVSHFLIMTN